MSKVKNSRGTFYLALTVFSLMGQIAWVVENMYLNVFIYKTFAASAADISYMVAASAITATLTTVFIGALADRIGRRKLFICSGFLRYAWGGMNSARWRSPAAAITPYFWKRSNFTLWPQAKKLLSQLPVPLSEKPSS